MDSRLKFYLYASSLVNAVLVVVVFCTLAFGETVDLDAICEIESACLSNPSTKQAKIYNPSSKARGAFQITEICLQDYLAYHPNEIIDVDQLYDYEISRKIASWFLEIRIPKLIRKLYGKKYITLENKLIAYNFGIGNLGQYLKGKKTLPRESANYIKKYKKLTGIK